MARVLTLDPSSSKTGYCVAECPIDTSCVERPKLLDAGVLKPGKGDGLEHSIKLADEIQAVIDEHEPALVISEIPPATQWKRKTNVAAQQWAFAMAHYVVMKSKIPHVLTIHPASWTRNRPQPRWAADIRERYKLPVEGDSGYDMAAAVGILDYWFSYWRFAVDLDAKGNTKDIRR